MLNRSTKWFWLIIGAATFPLFVTFHTTSSCMVLGDYSGATFPIFITFHTTIAVGSGLGDYSGATFITLYATNSWF